MTAEVPKAGIMSETSQHDRSVSVLLQRYQGRLSEEEIRQAYAGILATHANAKLRFFLPSIVYRQTKEALDARVQGQG